MRSTRARLAGSYNSTSGVMPRSTNRVVQPLQQIVVETFGDQQHGVGPGRPGLDHLVRVDDKILAQHGQIDRRADLAKILQAALEVRLVGQHADARRAVPLVDAGDLDRIEIGADHALARAGLLHFGDQPAGDCPNFCVSENGTVPWMPRFSSERIDGPAETQPGNRAPAGRRPSVDAIASGVWALARAISSRFVATIWSRIVGNCCGCRNGRTTARTM